MALLVAVDVLSSVLKNKLSYVKQQNKRVREWLFCNVRRKSRPLYRHKRLHCEEDPINSDEGDHLSDLFIYSFEVLDNNACRTGSRSPGHGFEVMQVAT